MECRTAIADNAVERRQRKDRPRALWLRHSAERRTFRLNAGVDGLACALTKLRIPE
jgi:hypothetical protein